MRLSVMLGHGLGLCLKPGGPGLATQGFGLSVPGLRLVPCGFVNVTGDKCFMQQIQDAWFECD